MVALAVVVTGAPVVVVPLLQYATWQQAVYTMPPGAHPTGVLFAPGEPAQPHGAGPAHCPDEYTNTPPDPHVYVQDPEHGAAVVVVVVVVGAAVVGGVWHGASACEHVAVGRAGGCAHAHPGQLRKMLFQVVPLVVPHRQVPEHPGPGAGVGPPPPPPYPWL